MFEKCAAFHDQEVHSEEREDEHEGQLRPSLFRSLHSPQRPLRPLKKGGDVLGSRPFPLQEMQLRRREKEEDTIWVRFPVPSADVIGKCFQKASMRRCFECTNPRTLLNERDSL